MARTTSTLVQGVLLRDYDTVNNPSLTPFIETANAMADRVEVAALARGTSLTVTELELIERWLAAHCYVMSDQTYSQKSTSSAFASFHGKTGYYLEGSKYGMMAMRLDPSGGLQAIGGSERKVAGGFWAGKTASQQVPYSNR